MVLTIESPAAQIVTLHEAKELVLQSIEGKKMTETRVYERSLRHWTRNKQMKDYIN